MDMEKGILTVFLDFTGILDMPRFLALGWLDVITAKQKGMFFA